MCTRLFSPNQNTAGLLEFAPLLIIPLGSSRVPQRSPLLPFDISICWKTGQLAQLT
jgi:hypothetical protein